MAQRVAAIFPTRDAAERAADALADLGADRGHISVIARGEDGRATTAAVDRGAEHHTIEPAREVGDAGAPLTTSEHGDTAKGAAIGAVAGLAAGLLALTVPGIGLVMAAGPLALAIAGGAIAGGVYGSLMDIGIPEHHARAYEERIRGGHVLLTALVPDMDQQRVRDVLENYDAEDITFSEDRSAATAAPAVSAPAMTAPAAPGVADRPAMAAGAVSRPGELRTPAAPETLQPGSAPLVVEETIVYAEAETEPEDGDMQVLHDRAAMDEDSEAEGENPETPAPSRRA